jgi:hypothetical protein
MVVEYETDYPEESPDPWVDRLIAPALFPAGVRYAEYSPKNRTVDSSRSRRGVRARRGF